MCAWEDRKEEEEEEREKRRYTSSTCNRGHDYRAEPVFIHKYPQCPPKEQKYQH